MDFVDHSAYYGYNATSANLKIQYKDIYSNRHQRLNPSLQEIALQKWKDLDPSVFLATLGDISLLLEKSDAKRQEIVVTGILIKDMKMRLSALNENQLAQKLNMAREDKFCDPLDGLLLEDAGGRIKLENLEPSNLCTGVVLAVRGFVDHSRIGVIEVQDWSLPPKIPRPPTKDLNGNHCLAFVGDLQIGQTSNDSLEALLGILHDEMRTPRIAGVVICGNLVSADEDSIRQADHFLHRLSNSLPVFVIPGDIDPTNLSLPQQALNPLLFPRSTENSNTKFLTNPCAFSFGGFKFLGSGGQLLGDSWKYTNYSRVVDCLDFTNQSRSLCPTAPDSLPIQPALRDPFLIEDSFHLIFSGAYSDSMWKEDDTLSLKGEGPVPLCIPSFFKKSCLVFCDLPSLSCQRVTLYRDD
jgi:DNA polymerase delta subunit 2